MFPSSFWVGNVSKFSNVVGFGFTDTCCDHGLGVIPMDGIFFQVS